MAGMDQFFVQPVPDRRAYSVNRAIAEPEWAQGKRMAPCRCQHAHDHTADKAADPVEGPRRCIRPLLTCGSQHPGQIGYHWVTWHLPAAVSHEAPAATMRR